MKNSVGTECASLSDSDVTTCPILHEVPTLSFVHTLYYIIDASGGRIPLVKAINR